MKDKSELSIESDPEVSRIIWSGFQKKVYKMIIDEQVK